MIGWRPRATRESGHVATLQVAVSAVRDRVQSFGQQFSPIGLRDDLHFLAELFLIHGTARIARSVEHRQIEPRLLGFAREVDPAPAAGQDDIGEQKFYLGPGEEHFECLRRGRSRAYVIPETLDDLGPGEERLAVEAVHT